MPGARDDAIASLAIKAVADAVRASDLFATLGVNVPLSINMPLDILTKLALGDILNPLKPDASAWPGLIIDLHEKSVIHDVPVAIEMSKKLAPLNVKLALDDFGNGYNAVAKAAALPFAEIKIGREFVTNCSIDKSKAAICKNAIELAHKFGAAAIAVGIERGAEVLTLAGMGCDGGQGYLLGQPMPETRFVSLLRLRANLPKAQLIGRIGEQRKRPRPNGAGPLVVLLMSGHLVLDERDHRGDHRAGHAAADGLADQSADIHVGCAAEQRRQKRRQDLASDAAADCADDGIRKRTKCQIFGGGTRGIAADCPRDRLNNEVGKHRITPLLPKAGPERADPWHQLDFATVELRRGVACRNFQWSVIQPRCIPNTAVPGYSGSHKTVGGA